MLPHAGHRRLAGWITRRNMGAGPTGPGRRKLGILRFSWLRRGDSFTLARMPGASHPVLDLSIKLPSRPVCSRLSTRGPGLAAINSTARVLRRMSEAWLARVVEDEEKPSAEVVCETYRAPNVAGDPEAASVAWVAHMSRGPALRLQRQGRSMVTLWGTSGVRSGLRARREFGAPTCEATGLRVVGCGREACTPLSTACSEV